jgi:hypothetical protein
MTGIQRYSPVVFDARAKKTETRDNWIIVLAYHEEGSGPWLVDLSHKTRWDLQDSQIETLSPTVLAVPSSPGACIFANNRLVNRMNPTQAAVWHLGIEKAKPPDFSGFTDVTESTAFLALFGRDTFRVAEKLTALDLMEPVRKTPFLMQGPLCHVPCQIVILDKNTDMSGGLLLTCSRGYTESMVQAVLDSGAEFNLRPAGETRFADWVKGLKGPEMKTN